MSQPTRKLSRKAALIIGGGFAVALLGAGVVLTTTSRAPWSRHADDAAESSADALGNERYADDATVSDPWREGQRFVFSLDFEAVLAMTGDIDEPTLAMDVDGAWTWTVIERDSDHAWIHVQLSDVHAEAGDASKAKQLEHAYSMPVYAKVSLAPDSIGAIQAVRVPPNMLSLVQSNYKAMLAHAQVIQPLGRRAAGSWKVDEVDATGRFAATYSREGEDLSKMRGPYKEVLAADFSGRPTTTTIESYDAHYEWTPGEGVLEAHVSELVKVQDDLTIGTARARSRLDLVRTERSSFNGSLDALLANFDMFEESPLHGGPTEAARQADRDAAWIADMDLDFMIEQLNTLDLSDPSERQLAGRAYFGLVSLVRQNEKAREDAAARIRAGDPKANELLAALGDAGTHACQDTLMDLMDAPALDADQRLSAMQGLTLVGVPSERVVERLDSLLDDDKLAPQAHYGTGSASYSLRRDGQSEAADAAADVLFDRLEEALAAGDQNAIQLTLAAISNAGDPRTPDRLQPLLQGEDARLRALAIDALRRVATASVDVILARHLQQDPSTAVRVMTVDTISQRKLSGIVFLALESAARKDEQSSVRFRAVSALASAPWPPEKVRPVLQSVVENEKRSDVRNMAQEWLEQHA